MLDVADQVCPQYRPKFEEVSLSRRTVASSIEVIGKDPTSEMKNHVSSFHVFSLELDESTGIDYTVQLIVFVRGISVNFEITGLPSQCFPKCAYYFTVHSKFDE